MRQALLPYPDFPKTAIILDTQCLGTQRKNILQILNILHRVILTPGSDEQINIDTSTEQDDSPVIKMWKGYEISLCEFGLTVCEQWVDRGGIDKYIPLFLQHMEWAANGDFRMSKPNWFGDEAYHLAQQSFLLRRSRQYYSRFFPDVRNDLPLVWPVSDCA